MHLYPLLTFVILTSVTCSSLMMTPKWISLIWYFLLTTPWMVAVLCNISCMENYVATHNLEAYMTKECCWICIANKNVVAHMYSIQELMSCTNRTFGCLATKRIYPGRCQYRSQYRCVGIHTWKHTYPKCVFAYVLQTRMLLHTHVASKHVLTNNIPL